MTNREDEKIFEDFSFGQIISQSNFSVCVVCWIVDSADKLEAPQGVCSVVFCSVDVFFFWFSTKNLWFNFGLVCHSLRRLSASPRWLGGRGGRRGGRIEWCWGSFWCIIRYLSLSENKTKLLRCFQGGRRKISKGRWVEVREG